MRSASRVTELALCLLAGCHCGSTAPAHSDASPDAPRIADAAIDSVPDAALACPAWTQPGRWLYVKVQSSDGKPLTRDLNHVDVYVHTATDPPPGAHASDDPPCAVASYAETPTLTILASAVGFVTIQHDFAPTTCTAAAPCLVVLPPALEPTYYVANRVAKASEVAADKQPDFAAKVAANALDSARKLHRPLAAELENAATATEVTAPDLAIHYTEHKLHKKCDASCLDNATVDPEMRTYLKTLRKPGHPNPFAKR